MNVIEEAKKRAIRVIKVDDMDVYFYAECYKCHAECTEQVNWDGMVIDEEYGEGLGELPKTLALVLDEIEYVVGDYLCDDCADKEARDYLSQVNHDYYSDR